MLRKTVYEEYQLDDIEPGYISSLPENAKKLMAGYIKR